MTMQIRVKDSPEMQQETEKLPQAQTLHLTKLKKYGTQYSLQSTLWGSFYEVGGSGRGYLHFKPHNILCTVTKQVSGLCFVGFF